MAESPIASLFQRGRAANLMCAAFPLPFYAFLVVMMVWNSVRDLHLFDWTFVIGIAATVLWLLCALFMGVFVLLCVIRTEAGPSTNPWAISKIHLRIFFGTVLLLYLPVVVLMSAIHTYLRALERMGEEQKVFLMPVIVTLVSIGITFIFLRASISWGWSLLRGIRSALDRLAGAQKVEIPAS